MGYVSRPPKAHLAEIDWPSADYVARAIVVASQVTGESPLDVVCGRRAGARARSIAFAALLLAFPDVPAMAAARMVGVVGRAATSRYKWGLEHKTRNLAWWREDWVDEVLGTLVADRIGAQAQ